MRCFRNEDDHFLEMEGTALLSCCDTNKAILSWTGVGHSLNSIQLSYYGMKVTGLSNLFIELYGPFFCTCTHPDHKSCVVVTTSA